MVTTKGFTTSQLSKESERREVLLQLPTRIRVQIPSANPGSALRHLLRYSQFNSLKTHAFFLLFSNIFQHTPVVPSHGTKPWLVSVAHNCLPKLLE
jgi:hypothetical protein